MCLPFESLYTLLIPKSIKYSFDISLPTPNIIFSGFRSLCITPF